MKKTCPYFYKWRHVHVFLHVHSCRQQGDSGLPHYPASGQSDWAGLLGKFPFVGNRFIRKQDVCLCTRTYSMCVCVCGRCMTLLDLSGLRSDLEHHLAWKQKVTHTLVLVPACAVCMWTRNEWDPVSPRKTHQLSDHVTVDNATLLVPTCTFWTTRQPANSILILCSSQACKTHFNSVSTLSVVQPSPLPA